MDETKCSCGQVVRLIDGHPGLRWADKHERLAHGVVVEMRRIPLTSGWFEHHRFEKPMEFNNRHPLGDVVPSYAVPIERCGHQPRVTSWTRPVTQAERNKIVHLAVAELDEEILLADGFEDALIGVAEVGGGMVALYDRSVCIQTLEAQGMTTEQAEEYFAFNVVGSHVGEYTPVFATILRR